MIVISHAKFANKCLHVRERVEVVEWNKRWSPPFPCCPVSQQCPRKKTLIEKNKKLYNTSWKPLEDIIQDVLKMCLRGHLKNVFLLKTSWRRLSKKPWRCLKDVLKTSWKRLEDVLKMSWRRFCKASWRRLEDVWPRRIYWFWSRCLEEVFWKHLSKVNIFALIKKSWRRLRKTKTNDVFKTSWRCLFIS